MELVDPARLDEARHGPTVEVAPAVCGLGPSDRNLAIVAEDGAISTSRASMSNSSATLRAAGAGHHPGGQEVERIGREMAKARGMTFQPTKADWHIGGTGAGSTNLASPSRCYAMIRTGWD